MSKTKSDEVAAGLEKAILGGEFKPGDSLPSQSVLASRYGVGLRAVRAGLGILEVKGLVEVNQGRKPVVSDNSLRLYMEFLLHSMGCNPPLDEDSLANLLGLMGMISAQSGKLVALAPVQRRRRVADELRRIIEHLKDCRSEDCRQDTGEAPPPLMTNYYRRKTYPADAESLIHSFHLELASSTGNGILASIYQALYAILSQRANPIAYSNEEIDGEIANFERIADGLASGDMDAVVASLVISLDARTRKLLRQARAATAGGRAAPPPPLIQDSAPKDLGGMRNKTKGEIIAQDIEKQILGGKYKSGDLLPSQNELCELYGASPRSIRDALGRLQTRALVDVGQGRRTRVRTSRLDHYIASLSASMRGVRKINGKLVMDLVQLDLILATSAARLACATPSPDMASLERLKSLAGRMRGLLPAADRQDGSAMEKFIPLAGRFHRALLALNANPFLDTIYDNLVSFLEMEDPAGMAGCPSNELRAAIDEHCRLVEAIEGRKSYLAVSAAVVIVSRIGRKLAEAYGLSWPAGARTSK